MNWLYRIFVLFIMVGYVFNANATNFQICANMDEVSDDAAGDSGSDGPDWWVTNRVGDYSVRGVGLCYNPGWEVVDPTTHHGPNTHCSCYVVSPYFSTMVDLGEASPVEDADGNPEYSVDEACRQDCANDCAFEFRVNPGAFSPGGIYW